MNRLEEELFYINSALHDLNNMLLHDLSSDDEKQVKDLIESLEDKRILLLNVKGVDVNGTV